MILVTGATGFIGSNLLFKLAKDNIHNIVATYRYKSNKDKIAALFNSKFPDGNKKFKRIIWRKAELRDLPSLIQAFEGIKKVYHCAAFISFAFSDRQKLHEINQKGTSYIVDLCLKNNIEKLVYVSSIASLGSEENENIIDENSSWDNNIDKTPYAYSKYGAEMEVWRGSQEGLSVAIVNPGIVLGPGSPMEKTFKRMKNWFRFYSPGTSGYVWVEDVIFVMTKLMNSEIKSERFALVAENWTGKSMILALLKAQKKNNPVIKISKGFLYFLWLAEYLLKIIGFRKRFFTKALIKIIFDNTKISGKKIKSFIDFEYTTIDLSIKNFKSR
jgi:nucleoside-diphosphate-sugar epimerase